MGVATMPVMGLAQKHVDELLKLPPNERSDAAEVLLLSLEQDAEVNDVGVEQAWAAEIERRIAEDAPGIPSETVSAEGRSRLKHGS